MPENDEWNIWHALHIRVDEHDRQIASMDTKLAMLKDGMDRSTQLFTQQLMRIEQGIDELKTVQNRRAGGLVIGKYMFGVILTIVGVAAAIIGAMR
jgi:hypothetical protein